MSFKILEVVRYMQLIPKKQKAFAVFSLTMVAGGFEPLILALRVECCTTVLPGYDQICPGFIHRHLSYIDCLSFVMCPLLAPVLLVNRLLFFFFAAAVNSSNKANKAVGMRH